MDSSSASVNDSKRRLNRGRQELLSPPAVRVHHPGILHSCGTTPPGARHCTSLIYSERRPNQCMQGFLVRAVGRARESDHAPSENLRSPSRPPAVCASCASDKSRENDKDLSCLRKRKNFEIFSTSSDVGDIGTGCRQAGVALPRSDKSRKTTKT